MGVLRGIKCARCSIRLQRSGEILSCPRCGVTDSRSAVLQEIAAQLTSWRARRFQRKVSRILGGFEEAPRMPISGQPCRFVYEPANGDGQPPELQAERPE